MKEFKLRRTMLYIPGNNPGMIGNADIFGADSVLFDLEDSVAASEKDAARELVGSFIKNRGFSNIEITVRVNPMGSEYIRDDLIAVVDGNLDAVRLPKTNSKNDVRELEKMLEEVEKEKGIGRKIRIHPMIETALGVENTFDIALSSKRIDAITIGGQDLTADMEIVKTEKGDELFYARTRIVMAAKAAGIDAMDTVYADVNNEQGLIEETQMVKKLGFTGKAVINPRQIKPVHNVFRPASEEIEWAREVINAYEAALKEGKGVIAIRGKMIDPPVVKRAQKIIAIAALENGAEDEE